MITENQFPEMMKRVKAIVAGAFPIESRSHSMSVSNLRWENFGDHIRDDPEMHKQHKIKDKTLSAKLIGNIVIKIKGGKIVDRETNFTILTLPHITNRSSYIVKGNEVQTVNQLRLRPGPYTRFNTDNNTETFINAAGGGYRTIFNRETKVFRLRSGSTYVYLYPILKALGITDGQLDNAWGREIVDANRKYDKPDQVARLYKSMRRYADVPKDKATLNSEVDAFFRSKELDPEISKLTLKKAFSNITPEVLLRASSKAINLAAGGAEPDDTESLAFKSIHSVEDFVPERLEKAIPGIQSNIKRMMDRKPKVSSLMSPATMSDPVINWFSTSEFTRYSNQMNPLDITSTSNLTTVMGEGGIQSAHAVTDPLRAVHPSQFGILDPLHSPEGGKIGVTGHLTLGATKKGNRIMASVIDAKTGKRVQKTTQELEDVAVAFHDQYDLNKKPPKPLSPKVKARADGTIKIVPAKQVKFIFGDPDDFFSFTTNAVPFLNTDHANRVLMADRHIEQAVPLVDPDKPLVQARFRGQQGYEDFFGRNMSLESPVNGTVSRVGKKDITIKDKRGKAHKVNLHHNYPLNGGAFLTEKAIVKAGDKVTAGQPIANNNFMKDGALALGKNLKVAFLPYKGYNFEDGTVISEGAAKKLSSEHKHEVRLDLGREVVVGLDRWLAHFPDESLNVIRTKYDSKGIIKKGQTVDFGDVLIPAVERVTPHEEYNYDRLHKSMRNPWRNRSKKWESEFPGTVVDVIKTAQFIKVFVKTTEPMQVGDKVSNRHGAKGIVTTILPDNEMYKDQKGKTIDMLFNPAGVPGRVNPGQMFEGAAGKIALKTDKTYLTDNFRQKENTIDVIQRDMKKAGVNDEETITDPTSGKKLNDVYVGDMHVMKLQHQVRKKFSARGIGPGYTVDEQPAKTSGASAQNIGSGELFSLLASGATHFLRDAVTLKSQANPEYWRAMQAGLPVPPPKQPFVLDKFVGYMKGAGINVEQDGTALKALPLTDKDILAQSAGEIKNPHVVRANDLKPEQGGLFDKGVTGGYDGTYWSHIDLATRMPNPLMERPIISVTGLKSSQFKSIMNGSLFVAKDGTLTTDDKLGLPAGEGIKVLLRKVNINKQLRETIRETRTAKGAKLNALIKKRKYLEALKETKISAVDAYTQSKVAIIPPKFRPIYPLPSGALNVADPNHGYREILMVNNQLKDLKKKGMDNKNLAKLRADLYGAMQGSVGMTEPLTRSKNFKGFIATIKGRQNKYGLFQGRVVKRPQDLSGRSTIIPDPKLGLDQAGVPEEMAMKIYKPFVMRRMVNLGYKPRDAADKIEENHDIARKVLQEEMKDRPLYLNRAPSLHKFSMMPFKAMPVAGKAIKINPLIVSGFNADFDGDTMGVHVPVSEEARLEAFKLLPSKQLFSSRTEALMHVPSKETVLGIYLMTKPVGKPVSMRSTQVMLTKLQTGQLKANSAVMIAGKIWTPGQALINDVFPADSKPGNVTLDKKKLNALLYKFAKAHPQKAGAIITKIKDLGNHYVTEIGFSFGIKDLRFDYAARDKIMAKAAVKAKRVGFEKAYSEATHLLQKEVAKDKKNRIVIGSIISGAFGKGNEVGQMIASPVAVVDHKNRVIPVPIGKSFAEGQDITSYLAVIPGARKGLADKGLKTQDTGALSKKLLNTTIEEVISMQDCGTRQGIDVSIESQDAVDRVIASGRSRGRVLSTQLQRSMKARGTKKIKVRSPLTCEATRGVCAKCFGLLENGQFPPLGYHVGALAGQSIGEPLTQLTLRAFHTGGAIGSKSVGFERVKQILEMPENVPGRAIIAQTGGRVTKVKKSAAGGWLVNVGDTDHFVPQERGLAVKKGQNIKAGYQLSQTGVTRPQDVLAATGDINKVRTQIIGDLNKEFSAGGVRVKRKLFETVVKPMTNRGEVIDAGDGERYKVYRGDIMSVNKLVAINKKIKAQGLRPIQYQPKLLSIRVSPYHGDDFVGKLMFERPHETLRAAPAIGATADIRSGHPITQYTFGKHFGKKKNA